MFSGFFLLDFEKMNYLTHYLINHMSTKYIFYFITSNIILTCIIIKCKRFNARYKLNNLSFVLYNLT